MEQQIQVRSRRRRRRKKHTFLVPLVALAVILTTYFTVKAVIGAKETPQTEVSQTQQTTESTEPSYTGLLAQADRLAQQYDYDGAKALVETCSGWQTTEELKAAYDGYTAAQARTVRYGDTTTIPHIFFHSLVADTARAFDGDDSSNGYNVFMTTVDEFRTMLDILYEEGYVLVDIHDLASFQEQPDGTQVMKQGDIMLPPEKKPLIMSQDDVNYYEYMVDGDGDGKADKDGDGFATRLVVGEDGKPTCAYITADGKTVTGAYDLVPILDEFLEQHPDFSYRGAKAILGITGYQGVLGYRTHPKYREILGDAAYEKEVADAKAAAQCLKDDGYVFASHSFGHPSLQSISVDALIEDTDKWETQCQPILGDTDILIYPYGADIAGVEDYSGAKFDKLYDAGFRYFCNVSAASPYWVQIHDTYVRQARINLDGYRLTHATNLIAHLLPDPESVLDPARPLPVPDL